jgi:hypothetical protein
MKVLTAKLTKVKILTAVGLRRRRYLIFTIFTAYVFSFYSGWIQLARLYKKNVSSLKLYFTKVWVFSLFLWYSNFENNQNNGILDLFRKIWFSNLKHSLFMQLNELYPTTMKKRRQKSCEILSCGHITYVVITVKIKYLPLGKSTAANMLTLL